MHGSLQQIGQHLDTHQIQHRAVKGMVSIWAIDTFLSSQIFIRNNRFTA